VTGTYLVSRLFLPKLRPNSTDCQCLLGRCVRRHELGRYAASKAAVLSLTKVHGARPCATAIRVNAVIPVLQATPMLEQMWGTGSGPNHARVSGGRSLDWCSPQTRSHVASLM